MQGRGASSMAGYLVAAGATAAMLLIRWLLDPWMGGNLPFLTLFGAVAAAVWIGGYGPALVAAALGYVASSYLFVEPRGTLAFHHAHQYIGLVLYSLTCCIIIGLGEGMRFARRRAESGRKEAIGRQELLEREAAERKRAEEELRRAEEKSRSVVDHVVDGIITIDERGTVESLNPAAEKIFGYPAAEVIGRNVKLLMPQPFRDDHDEYLAGYLRTGEAKIIGIGREVEGRRKDGSTFPMDLAVSEFRIGSGRRFTGIVRDITERRRAEEALREGEERLRVALEAGRMGTWEWKFGTNEVIWSPALEEIHGLAPGTFDGTFAAYQNDIYPDDRERVLRSISQTVERGRDHCVEYRIVRPDGSVRWVEGRGKLFRDESGAPVRMVGVCLDITERKRAEAALAEQARLLDLSLDAIFVRDPENRITYWSRGAVEAYGFSAAEALGQVSHELLRTEFPEPLGGIEATLRRSGSWQGELIHTCKDRSRVTDLSRWALSPSDSRAWVLETNTNITERKRAEQGLLEADRRKDEFLAILAHELRNPLAAVAIAGDVLRRARIEDEHARFATEVISRQMVQLQRLVEDLLDVARAVHGKLKLETCALDLLEIARDAASDHLKLLERQVLLEVVGEPAWALGDRARVRQMVENLLDNAAKFSATRIVIRVGTEGEWACLSIEDNGQGIPAELLPHLFEPFVQGEQPADRIRGGLGLGLALVNRLAVMHGGSLDVRSDGPGKGSCFTFRLPQAGAAAASAENRPAAAALE